MFARCIKRSIFSNRIPSSSRPSIVALSTAAESFISPVLLRRARSVAEEHAKLATQNAENYDVATAKKIGELSTVTAALAEWDNAQNVSSSMLRYPAVAAASIILTNTFVVH